MLNKPNIKEMCKDEIKDFILDLVQKELNNIPSNVNCRRKEICKSILDVNTPTGVRRNIRENVMRIFKTEHNTQKQIRSLSNYGFTVTKGKTHYKIKWDYLPYYSTLSTSPGDCKSDLNQGSDVIRTFF